MLITVKSALCFPLAGSILVLAACGGSGGDSSTPAVSTTPTLQQRTDAATSTVANNAACTTITPFYWEIGDANGLLASGSGGDNSAVPPDSTTAMPIASASKWIFSTYVVERQGAVLSASDIDFLTFKSGYVNLSSCSNLATVAGCLSETGALGGTTTNGDYFSAADGRFFYNGGHMQVLASNMGMGPDHIGALTTDIESIVGASVAIAYVNPQLAGGVDTTPAGYAQFLRNMLGGQYSHMLNLLGSNAVCTHTNSTDCPTALFSPVNESQLGSSNDVSEEQWHYSLGHWVEDDPTVGDGAFSSPGRFGFYPWIDKSKTYYGLVARYDTANVANPDPRKASYITSVYCGRLIREAWELGQPR